MIQQFRKQVFKDTDTNSYDERKDTPVHTDGKFRIVPAAGANVHRSTRERRRQERLIASVVVAIETEPETVKQEFSGSETKQWKRELIDGLDSINGKRHG